MNTRLYKAVIVVLIIFFLGGIGLGLWNITMNEGVYLPDEAPKESLTPAPRSSAEVAAYLERVTADVLRQRPKVTREGWFAFAEKDGIVFSVENPLLDKTAAYMKNKITAAFNKTLTKAEVSFGEDMSNVFSAPYLSGAGGFSAVCTDEKMDDAGEVTCLDTNEITVRFDPIEAGALADSLLARNFTFRTDEEIRALLGNAFDAYFTIDSYTLKYGDCRINASVDRFTDRLKRLDAVKSTTASLNITPVGSLAPLGQMTLTVVLEEVARYNFTWPGLKLDKHELTMKKSGTENLLAYITADDGLHATWWSSDDSIVSVDEQGYLKAHKNGTAVIRASVEFQGQTFEDDCVVHVGVAVEGLRLDKHKLTLATGETAQLRARVSPRKASVQGCKWYTENSAVATVDQNGVVTAVGTGETKVFALTDEGSFRSSCRVTVE